MQLERSHDIIHAREWMDESKNAQLVIQHTQLEKLEQTVIAKEKSDVITLYHLSH